MSLFALSDLHLGFAMNKPMDKFGPEWENHAEKIEENWKRTIKEEDTVLLPGDTSWAMTLEEALPDLEFIHTLPGRKIFVQGNHDYWWNSTTKINQLYEDMFFLKNSFAVYEDYAVCGTRGWVCPGDSEFTAHDQKIYNREMGRLRLSLEAATKAGYGKMIVMLHYPPTNDKKESSGFLDIVKAFPVERLVYGHLHGRMSQNRSLKGMMDGVEYNLVSVDYLGFRPFPVICREGAQDEED